MSIKQVVLRQYREIVNTARKRLFTNKASFELEIPNDGWLRTVRIALNMSGAQLARRLGVTRAQVSNTERAELSGRVTIKTMQQMAEAMNCRFVYAIIPESTIEKTLQKRALEKAKQLVKTASIHMALEDQLLSDEQLQEQLKMVASELLAKSTSKLWDDE